MTRLSSEHLTRAHLHGSGSAQPGGLRLFLRESITEASSWEVTASKRVKVKVRVMKNKGRVVVLVFLFFMLFW